MVGGLALVLGDGVRVSVMG